jgi:enolase
MLDARWHTEQGEARRDALLAVSLANAKASRISSGSLFSSTSVDEREGAARAMMNIINGGAHSDAPIDFQEFMIVPRASTPSRRAARGHGDLPLAEKRIKGRGLSTASATRRIRAEVRIR